MLFWCSAERSFGASSFLSSISSINQLVSDFGISHQQYADDIQLYIAIYRHLTQLQLLLDSNLVWPYYNADYHNGLCLNPDKFEAIIFGTQQQSLTFPVISSDHLLTLLAPWWSSLVKWMYIIIIALHHCVVKYSTSRLKTPFFLSVEISRHFRSLYWLIKFRCHRYGISSISTRLLKFSPKLTTRPSAIPSSRL